MSVKEVIMGVSRIVVILKVHIIALVMKDMH